jgi:hypothetical protein
VAFLGIGAATLAVTGLAEASRRLRVPDGLAAPAGEQSPRPLLEA